MSDVADNLPADKPLIALLRLGTFLCFAGWTWVHFYWEGPYGVLLWHDTTYELASRWGISWEEFVGSGANDGWVQAWIARVAWLFVGCMVLSLTARQRSWWQLALLGIGGTLLMTVVSYAKYLSANSQLPMFVEHGGQILMPLLLVLGLSLGARHWVTRGMALLAVITTFAGHGSYALGLWPTPANFYGMISVVLHVDYEWARFILRTAGLLDFVVCVGLFIPWVRRGCALYAALWGLLTAIARPVAGMSPSLYYWGADQFVHEAVLRAPHFVIPLYLFWVWSRPTTLAEPPADF